ncbi:MAG: hypothetical protein R3B65_03855 [Candidatus Paceibacterota bacterium]
MWEFILPVLNKNPIADIDFIPSLNSLGLGLPFERFLEKLFFRSQKEEALKTNLAIWSFDFLNKIFCSF